jgi:glycosyltransferase involved in cell wall biosynthesis
MKVLFLSHQAEFIYGGEVCTLAFMQELVEQGVDVHFASPRGPYSERARKIAAWHEIPSRQFGRKITMLPSFAISWKGTERRLADIIKKEKIDVLHATSLKAMVFASPLRKKLPVIWHHHDILPPGFWNDRWANLLAKAARLILVPSAATRLALLQSGVNPLKIKVLNNGFSISEWQVRPAPRLRKLKLAFVGELSERKGVDRLPAILASCSKKADCELVLVGEAVSDPGFGKKIREEFSKGKGEAIFLGLRSDVKEILQGIDILLVPSRQDPLPTVIVEAGLSGVPVLAAPVGGIPEMVHDGENGFLVEHKGDWVDRILALQEKELWEKCSQGARSLAEARYDISKLAMQLCKEYEALVFSE